MKNRYLKKVRKILLKNKILFFSISICAVCTTLSLFTFFGLIGSILPEIIILGSFILLSQRNKYVKDIEDKCPPPSYKDLLKGWKDFIPVVPLSFSLAARQAARKAGTKPRPIQNIESDIPEELFLVVIENVTLLDGTGTEIVGVFSSFKKAYSHLKKVRNFKHSDRISTNAWKALVFDGELSIFFEIRKIKINETLDYF